MPSRFLAKGRGVIGLPLQQPQVATRVTRFQGFCLIASQLQPWRCALCRRIVIAAGPTQEPPKIGAVALVMWNMRKRHFSHSCKPAAAEPSVKAARSLRAAERSERSGEPLRTAERRLHARERAAMPVPASRPVLSRGSPSGSRRLLPQQPSAAHFAVNRHAFNRFPPQEPPATLQHPSRGDVSPILPMPKAAPGLEMFVLTRNSGPDSRSGPRRSSEVQPAKQPVIVAGVGVGIRRQDGGQPVFHVQFERDGDLRHMDAERPPQLPECATEGPAMEAPAVSAVDRRWRI